LSVGDGMERAWRSQIAETSALQAISVRPRMAEEVDGQFFPIRDPQVFSPADARALSTLPGVDGATITLWGQVEVRSPDGKSRRMASLTAQITHPDSSGSRPLLAGRRLAPNESEGDAPRVMVSYDLARDLSTDSNAHAFAGRAVMIENTETAVIGVLPRAAASSALTVSVRQRADYRVIVPFGFAQAVLPKDFRSLPTLTVHAARIETTDVVKNRVQAWLAARDTAWARHTTVTTSEARLEQVVTGILMFKLFMGAITGISLLVGGLGIMNVLLSSVTERTREIGIRKAAGARDGDIRLQFLAESVAISGVGSAIGLLLGVSGAFGITAMIRHFSRAPFLHASLSWSTLAVAASAALFVGLVFGTYPARRAARLSPIDAIRHE